MMEGVSHANSDQKKARVDMLISSNVDFRAEDTTKDEEGPLLVSEMPAD